MMLRRDLLPWAKYVKKRLLDPPLPGEPDTRPFCIYTEAEAELFYSLPEKVRAGWQAYCQHEINAWNEREYMDRQAHLYHQWRPPLVLAHWIERHGTAL